MTRWHGTATVALLVLGAVLAAGPGWCVGGIQAVADKSEVTVGDPFTYTVTLTVPEGAKPTLPGAKAKFGKLEVRDYQLTEAPPAAGTRTLTLKYTLVAFDVGAADLNSFRIPVQPAKGKPELYLAPPVTVTVKSVLPQKGKIEPKGYYGPITLKAPWVEWAYAAAIALLIAGAVATIIWFLKRRKAEAIVPVEQLLGPEETAILALDRLRQDKVIARGDMVGFYVRLDEILRAWLAARLELPAMHRTTTGIMYLLRVRRDTDIWRPEFLDLLKFADSVKFAAVVPDDATAYDHVDRAQALIKEAAHLLAPPPPEGGTGP